jgi:nucleoid-associated protein YgaU
MSQLNEQNAEMNRLRTRLAERVTVRNPDPVEARPVVQDSGAGSAAGAPPVAENTSGRRPVKRTYQVQPGDSLISIAKKMYGDGRKWDDIYQANRDELGRADRLRVGQVLEIP